MIGVKISDERIRLRFDSMPEALRQALGVEADSLAKALQSKAKAKASGDVLNVVTGKYVESIRESVRVNTKSVVGKVFSKDPRAGIFEWGGHTKPHLIEPKGKALAFMTSGGEVFAAVVHHPGSHIAKHSVINSAFGEMQSQIIGGLTLTGLGVIKGGN